MTDCECNVCKVLICLRNPKKAEPILPDDHFVTQKQIFADDCRCNICEVIECIRRPKKVMPITEQPVQPVAEPTKMIIEKVIIKEKPCPPQPYRLPPCDPSRVTVYGVGTVHVTAYAVSQPSRIFSYGVPHCNDSHSYTNHIDSSISNVVTSLYGVKSPETSCNFNKHSNEINTSKAKKKRQIGMK